MRSWTTARLQLTILLCAMILLTGCATNLPKLTSGNVEIGPGITRQISVLKHPTDEDFVPPTTVGICIHF